MAIPGILDDIIPLILNNLTLDDIKTFACLSTSTCNIVQHLDWEQYYFNRVNYLELYDDKIIDFYFMKSHGKYLININDKNAIVRWFKFYNDIIDIIHIFDNKSIAEIWLSVDITNNFYITRSIFSITITHKFNDNVFERVSYKTLFDEIVDIVLDNDIFIIDCLEWTD